MTMAPPNTNSSEVLERVRAFTQQYGWQALDLAAHAAFPWTLTTDLIYCLRETFLPECPWYAAADVLLSGLCRWVGHDLFEMEPATRQYLLQRLRDRFTAERVYEVERFMVAYLRHRLKQEEPSERALMLGEKPHWTSLACLRPGEAREAIQQTLQQIALADVNSKDRFRLAALVESYGDFLADQGFQPILVEWADRLAEGQPIDATAAIAAQLVNAGFQARMVEFEVATIQFGLDNTVESLEAEGLQPFEFETVTVDEWGEVLAREPRQGLQFVEPLAAGVPPLEMVAILSGEFNMGSPESEHKRYDDEGPQHQVHVAPFFISKYPITQAQWRVVTQWPQQELELSPDPSHFKGDNRPVEQVNWYEAVEFCRRLSEVTGRTYRLPTEAEWEYACRADTTTPFAFGATITTELANYDGSVYRQEKKGKSRGETTDVGSFPPNGFGLCDMHGNVWEWCQDHWHEKYEGAPTDGSAWLTNNDNTRRVIRGGSWISTPRDCRSASRVRDYPDVRNGLDGFRVVCVAPRTL